MLSSVGDMDWLESLITILNAISDVLTAGVAIISFSLFIYSVTFSLRDRVTNTFTLLLFSLIVIFGADAFLTITENVNLLIPVIEIHWLGIIFLPAIYFLFSDSLLTTTGKPSRGKRRIAGILFVTLSTIFVILLFNDLLVGEIITNQPPAPFLMRTGFTDLFSIFFILVLSLSWYNFIRAFRRTATQTSRRRMLYLIVSALGPAFGSFPYLLYGSQFAENMQVLFWVLSIAANAFVYIALIAMAYSVSFFGFPWTDRLIKSRLFRWVLRGPITASLTLGMTTIVSRLGVQYNFPFTSALVILAMVSTIVLFEYMITLFAPIWERIFFSGNDRVELEKVRLLEDRLLTTNDIQQFLELILATICDRLQINGASLIVNNNSSNSLSIKIGSGQVLSQNNKEEIYEFLNELDPIEFIVESNNGTIIPLRLTEEKSQRIYGAVVIDEKLINKLDAEKMNALLRLIDRVAFALREREEQEKILGSFEMLVPQTSAIQNLIAVSRFDQQRMINGIERIEIRDLEKWVKDALTQIWGGPKIIRNPIMQLKIVQKRIEDRNESPINAVREILREAMSRLRPEGERQYTNEWILYNLIDLKFFEGWKVKDIARRIALSEADYYRKQRAAISSISRQIIEMERIALQKST